MKIYLLFYYIYFCEGQVTMMAKNMFFSAQKRKIFILIMHVDLLRINFIYVEWIVLKGKKSVLNDLVWEILRSQLLQEMY